MKKVIKNILNGLLIFILFLWLIFWLWYYFKIKRDLVDYNISEKIVVKFENDDNKYLVNLNDWSYQKTSDNYQKYDFENDINIGKKNYNKNNDYYFYYKSEEYYKTKIYNKNNEVIYNFIHRFDKSYWSQDWKYLISKSWYVARMFWLFIPIKTANSIIIIIDPNTWKSKQLHIIDEKWRYLEVESILWYVE